MLAERLRKSIEDNVIRFDNNNIKVSISIGASTLEEQESDFAPLLARADQALYSAKAHGRNRVEIVPTPQI
jgi:diguanylate cyclase (GGDEF)-like protein